MSDSFPLHLLKPISAFLKQNACHSDVSSISAPSVSRLGDNKPVV